MTLCCELKQVCNIFSSGIVSDENYMYVGRFVWTKMLLLEHIWLYL